MGDDRSSNLERYITQLGDLVKSVPHSTSPFSHTDRLDAHQALIFLLSIVILPVKIVLLIVSFFLIFLTFRAGTLCCFSSKSPINCAGKVMLSIGIFLSRTMLCLFGIFHMKTVGKKAKSNEAPIFVAAPHSSVIDGPLLCAALGPVSLFAKSSVTKLPVVASVAKGLQTILINRRSADSKQAAMEVFKKRATELFNGERKWLPLFSFPEGTCTNRKSLITFKRGAFTAGLPVQVVVVRWPSSKSCWFDMSWTVGGPNRMYLFIRALMQIYVPVTIEFCPVLTPTEEEIADPNLFASRAREVAAQRLDLPVSEHSYQDRFFAAKVLKLGLPVSQVCDFEFSNLPKTTSDNLPLDFSVENATRIASKFICNSRGFMGFDEFCAAFHIPVSKRNSATAEDSKVLQVLKNIFDSIVSDDDGVISFRSFLVSVVYLGSVGKQELQTLGLTEADLVKELEKSEKGSDLLNLRDALFKKAKNDAMQDYLVENPELSLVILHSSGSVPV